MAEALNMMYHFQEKLEKKIENYAMWSILFLTLKLKVSTILVFTDKMKANEEDLSKLSTDEIQISIGLTRPILAHTQTGQFESLRR